LASSKLSSDGVRPGGAQRRQRRESGDQVAGVGLAQAVPQGPIKIRKFDVLLRLSALHGGQGASV